MLRRALTEGSPLRRLEQALGGRPCNGQLGVVAARAGVGKTPLLVHLAIDVLLGGRRVLHVSRGQSVEHVRAYYDEILVDLGARLGVEALEEIRLELERSRLILSTVGASVEARDASARARAALDKLRESVAFAREAAEFDPDVIVVDGLDFVGCASDVARGLVEIGDQARACVWATATVEARSWPDGAGELPSPLDSLGGILTCVLFLEPEADEARLRLIDVRAVGRGGPGQDLGLRFQPHSMRIIDEQARAVSDRPRDPARFRLVSGGCKGAEAEFGACAERWSVRETHFSFPGQSSLARERGVVVLGEVELGRGDVSLRYASKRLGRELGGIPAVRRVLQSICHQITEAEEVFVVGTIQEDGTVRGGTGWGAELARTWGKPLYVFDQGTERWYSWSSDGWQCETAPTITRETFAGIGTQKLEASGRAAIAELFERSFGPA